MRALLGVRKAARNVARPGLSISAPAVDFATPTPPFPLAAPNVTPPPVDAVAANPLARRKITLLLRVLEQNRKRLQGCHFSGKLNGLNLPGGILSGASFAEAILSNCDFEDCDLKKAVFAFATIDGGSFDRSVMTGASFANAEFVGEGATFKGVVLNDVNLEGASFETVDFEGAKLDLSHALKFTVNLGDEVSGLPDTFVAAWLAEKAVKMTPDQFRRWKEKKVRPVDPTEYKRWQKDGYNVDDGGNPTFADGSIPASNHADASQEQ